ncbi:uncharacterized protein [Palaemon carinicauda]
MASSLVVDDSSKRDCLLRMIQNEVIRPVMRKILAWVTPDWDQASNFVDYLKSKNMDVKILEKNSYAHQMDAIKNDPGGSEWDTTLIHLLLRLCGGLAGKDEKAWSSGSGIEPECFITQLKDIRNNLAHKTVKLSKEDFVDKTEEIRGIIKDLFKSMADKYPLLKAEIDENLNKFNCEINKIRDASFMPENLEDCRKSSCFLEMTKLVREKGVLNLKEHLEKITSFNPLSLIVKDKDKQIAVSDVFTGMQLEKGNEREEVLLENLIDIASGTSPGGLLLLKGHAGIGKTTILKKITSDWVKQTGTIKGLDSYDLLLYAEFRGRVESFQELLEYFLGDVRDSFDKKDLVRVALSLRNLVILDGFDEINSRSSQLFQDILSLIKKYKTLTVIVTTRPEAEDKLALQLSLDNINSIHVWLIGIEKQRRAEFVTKYFHSLTQNDAESPGLGGLLEYLKKTQYRMSEVWKLPYNLSLVTILWILKSEVVNIITTEAELYWQMLIVSISKLVERLQKSPVTSHLPESVLADSTEDFLKQLSWQSLLGLKNDDIYLPETAYQEMKDLCREIKVPIEELAGAFLKKVTTSKDSRYSFPHKGNQEFMGAYNIYLKFKKAKRTKQKVKVRDILRDLHDGSPPDSLAKYQNLLIQTLSVLHVCGIGVSKDIKKELLNLLEESGLKDKDSWLKVLHNLKCDDITAKWIADRYKILTEKMSIEDFTFDAYNSLLKAIETAPPSRDKINVDIDLDETPIGLDELGKNIVKLQLNVKNLVLKDLFKGFSSNETSSLDMIPHLMKCCVKYIGIWKPGFVISPGGKYFFVNLPDPDALNDFFACLPTATGCRDTRICMSVNIGRKLRPIPKSIGSVSVYIKHVTTKEEIAKVKEILFDLRPEDEDRVFPCLFFPRCSLNVEGIHYLLDCLKGVRVEKFIAFPISIEPDEKTCEQIKEKAEAAAITAPQQQGITWDEEVDIFKVV